MNDKKTIRFWQFLFMIQVCISLLGLFAILEQKEVIQYQNNVISLQEEQIDLIEQMHLAELEFQKIVYDVRLESVVNECYLTTGYEVKYK